VVRLTDCDPVLPPAAVRRDLALAEKRSVLRRAITESHSYFENALQRLTGSNTQLSYRIGLNSNAGFTCFVSQDRELIKACRVYIDAGFSGITYDGNTHSALLWDVDEIKKQVDETKRLINENLQSVIDGNADAAALVRSLDAKTDALRRQLNERNDLLIGVETYAIWRATAAIRFKLLSLS
jgi:hypothetical protein